MEKSLKTLALIAAFGTVTAAAIAQPMGSGPNDMMGPGRMDKRDPARMEAKMTQRTDALKAQLKLTPEQEPAWNAFVNATKPDSRTMPQHPSRDELVKLTTPERIDKMRALRNEQYTAMLAIMDKHDQATKAFYNSLNAEQKKVFDSQHMRMGGYDRNQRGGFGMAPGAPAKP